MKNLFLLIVFLSFIQVQGQTSVYHPFPESDAVWSIYFSQACPPPTTENDYYTYVYGNDTVINNRTYHALTIPFIQTSFPVCNRVQAGYIAALRQDTALRKVYYIAPNDSIEKVLYDFSLVVGDTFHYDGFWCLGTLPVVIGIDSILIGGSYRKKWFFNSSYIGPIVEGIGSLDDMFFVCEPNPPAPVNWTLMCFSHSGQGLYPGTGGACHIILDRNEVDKASNRIQASIYPNPFHSSATLKISNFDNLKRELNIYDALGGLRVHQPVSSSLTEIERINLNGGIYFYNLMDARGNVVSGKFIIE